LARQDSWPDKAPPRATLWWSIARSPYLIAGFKGEGKGYGWNMGGDNEERGEKRESISTPPVDPSNFLAVVAPIRLHPNEE